MPPKAASWLLQAQQSSLQAAMGLGMYIGSWAGPWPPEPSFTLEIPSTISPIKGKFKLVFYVPKSYLSRDRDFRYPCVVNYHGGGMSIGTGTDDSRFAQVVMRDLEAVFVSVEYRLAPKHPFPTAVQDSADAILYLIDHAERLGLDPHRLTLSGFSSGGNLVFTAPILLEQLRSSPISSDNSVDAIDDFGVPVSRLPKDYVIGDYTIRCIMAWYPSVDFTKTREERRATNPHQSIAMPVPMSRMFDTGYVYNSHLGTYESAHPLLSPAQAPGELLQSALPSRILMYTCEYDSLQQEGQIFANRLSTELDKRVTYRMVEKVAHAWDKMPNPIWTPERIEELYSDACSSVKEDV